jgi:hypothetical protein
MKKLLTITFLTLAAFLNIAKAEDEKPTEPTRKYGLTFDKIDSSRFFGTALVQILDKTTAKSIDAEIKVGNTLDFGNIKIKVLKCWQAPLDQNPDSRILMEVFEKKPINSKKEDVTKKESPLFYGWMIASSPSVSSLEHPVYDITALNCKK